MKKNSWVAPRMELKQEQADGLNNSLELRLGISSDNGCGSPWPGVGVDPWSLAARQEKAALEQARHRENSGGAEAAPHHQLVGWPPVRAFRKNLSAAAKPADGAAEGKAAGGGSMFVKVNLEGCGVGRKVDLQAHRGYGSLSRALQAMFHAFFLPDGRWRIAGREEDSDSGDGQPESTTKVPQSNKKKTYILLYEDNEGDRMLVGDVPWELFVASVKRLYIAQDPRAHN